jgi:hypothetical protein
MRQVTVDLYQFDELEDMAKERARSWYREAGAGGNYFAESTLNDAHEWITAMGFNVSRKDGFRWSGFWSHGDGASFVGTYDATRRSELALAMLRADRPVAYVDNDGVAHQGNAAWHALAERLDAIVVAAPTLTASLTVRDWDYSHPRTVQIERDDGAAGFDEYSQSFNTAAEQFTALARDIMAQIYRELEFAYEWENADEQVDESICVNEYEFSITCAPRCAPTSNAPYGPAWTMTANR